MQNNAEQQIKNNNQRTKQYHGLYYFAVAFVLLCTLGSFNFYYSQNKIETLESTTNTDPSPEYLETVDGNRAIAIRNANISVAENAPSPDIFGTVKKNDAENLFDIAHLQYSFNLATKTVDYLVKILDSESKEFEPYKSIAAYSLLHTFYDTGGDVEFMANAVGRSVFMKNLEQKAGGFFPGLFEKTFDEMSYFDKTRYFTSYLVALSDREDSMAIPANAALELSRAYIASKKTQNIDDDEFYKNTLNRQLDLVLSRMTNRFSTNSTSVVSAHDTVTGLNLLSATIDNLRSSNVAQYFPQTTSINIVELLDLSYEITQKEVPSLEMFTAYLNALYSTKYLEATPINNERIDFYIKKITGPIPFEKINQYSWAIKHFTNTTKDYSSPFFKRENIALIANRSVTLREFLITKDGWGDEDFLVTN